MYDPKSMCADDFIDHQEILDTLAYAEEHKSDAALISSIIEKAKERKGLSHRDASVLLACDIEEKNQEIFALAEQIKKDLDVYKRQQYASGSTWLSPRRPPL